MRKIPVLILAAAALSGLAFESAQAQGRPDSLRMSCASAQRIVQSRGAAVVGTGRNLYDRYVAAQGFCQRDEIAKPAWVASGDTRQCFIGYTCERENDDYPF